MKPCSHCRDHPAMPSDYYCSPCKITAMLLAKAVKHHRLSQKQQQILWRETYGSITKTNVLLATLRGK